jgi:hypothetical protein
MTGTVMVMTNKAILAIARGRVGGMLTCAWLLCANLLSLDALGGVMQNEPRDFRGIEWGAPLEPHKSELVLLMEDEGLAHYRRAADSMVYANVDARRVSYRFYKNRFSAGMILTVGSTNLKSVVDYLTETYGPPETVNLRHRVYNWVGERAGITVSCDITISCYVEFYGREMRELELAEQRPAKQEHRED